MGLWIGCHVNSLEILKNEIKSHILAVFLLSVLAIFYIIMYNKCACIRGEVEYVENSAKRKRST